MDLIVWSIVGIVVAAFARRMVPGEGPGGILGDLSPSVIGALAGGWLFQTFGGSSYGGWIGSMVAAYIGAVILLFVLRLTMGRRTA